MLQEIFLITSNSQSYTYLSGGYTECVHCAKVIMLSN